MSALASLKEGGRAFSKRDVLWNMKVILIQFAAFLAPFLSNLASFSLNRGRVAVTTKATRFFWLNRSKVEVRKEFREFVSRCFLARSAWLSCQGVCMPTFNQEFSEASEGSRNRCLLFSAVARQQNHFPFIELTQSNQPSSHLLDFALIELIIFEPPTHTHALAAKLNHVRKEQTGNFFPMDFVVFFPAAARGDCSPFDGALSFLPPKKSTSRI